MVPTGLHLGGWKGPAFGIPIDLAPHFIDNAGWGMVGASKRKAKNLKTHVTSYGSVTPGRGVANVGNHLPIHVSVRRRGSRRVRVGARVIVLAGNLLNSLIRE
jgi:hypothetical protein